MDQVDECIINVTVIVRGVGTDDVLDTLRVAGLTINDVLGRKYKSETFVVLGSIKKGNLERLKRVDNVVNVVSVT
ncbi:MAG: hypothetical protein HZA35_00780 [Parcubacteria group bacterium]|nr:hypothetical protein [Parcubacteria group bacterium]